MGRRSLKKYVTTFLNYYNNGRAQRAEGRMIEKSDAIRSTCQLFRAASNNNDNNDMFQQRFTVLGVRYHYRRSPQTFHNFEI